VYFAAWIPTFRKNLICVLSGGINGRRVSEQFVFYIFKVSVGRVAQSVYRLTTGWTVRGSKPVGAKFFAHVQTGPEDYPASCTMGTASFPGVKRPGRGAYHPRQMRALENIHVSYVQSLVASISCSTTRTLVKRISLFCTI
jgi:hypothetical protein